MRGTGQAGEGFSKDMISAGQQPQPDPIRALACEWHHSSPRLGKGDWPFVPLSQQGLGTGVSNFLDEAANPQRGAAIHFSSW